MGLLHSRGSVEGFFHQRVAAVSSGIHRRGAGSCPLSIWGSPLASCYRYALVVLDSALLVSERRDDGLFAKEVGVVEI